VGAVRFQQFHAIVEAAVAGEIRSIDDRGWLDTSTLFVVFRTNSVETSIPAASRVVEAVRGVCGPAGAYPSVSAYCGVSFGPIGFDEDVLGQACDLATQAGQIHSLRPLCSSIPRRGSVRRRCDLESCLGDAVSNGEISVVYQSIHGSEDKDLVGFEALARWTSPVFGIVPPDQFIPIAEKSGAIHEIGDWVLAEACRDLAAFRTAHQDVEAKMSINASVNQLTSASFPRSVLDAASSSGVPPENLVIEVTESVFADQEVIGETLGDLHDLGAKLSLDDVGTGYASLSQLAALPIDWIKIDRSLTAPGRGYKWEQVLRAVVALGRSLGMEVVAEGMETSEHIELARSVGCSMLQGFHLSLPESIDKILLDGGTRWAAQV